MARLLPVLLALVVLAGACRGDPAPAVSVEEAGAAQVTETVAAPGRLAPAASEQVLAEVGGTIVAIEVDDGAAVDGGAVVMRLASEDLDAALAQIEDARAALDDLTAPVAVPDLGALERAALPQLDPVDLPDVAVPAVNPAAEIVAQLDRSVRPKLDAARAQIPGAVADLRAAVEEARAALDAWVEDLLEALPPDIADDITPPDLTLPDLPDEAAARAALDELEASYEAARAALLAAGAAAAGQQAAAADTLAAAAQGVATQLQHTLATAVGELVAAQAAVQQASFAALEQQAAQAVEAQAAELDAAAEQLAARADALTVEAPFGGLVELATAGAAGPGLGAFGGLADDALAGGLGRAGLGGAGLGGFAGNGSGGDAAPLRVGARVRPGQPLFTVYDLSAWYVEAEIDELDAPGLAVGQRADVTIDAFPGEAFEGVVESVRLAATPSITGAVVYPARIRLLAPPAERGPRVGMTASVEITTAVVDAELTVPSRALVRRDGADAVYVVRDGQARVVPVTIRALGDERAAVQGALEVGEAVVVAGYEELPDGSQVELE